MNPNAWLERMHPRLNRVWRGSWKTGTTEPGRYLFDHELVVVTRGACQVQVDSLYHELTAGTFLIIPPGAYHATTTHRGGVHRCCFHFDWDRTASLRRQLSVWVYHPARPRSADVKTTPAFVPRHAWQGIFDPGGAAPPLMETIFHRHQAGTEQDRMIGHATFAELLLCLLWQKSDERPPRDRATQLAYAVKELLDTTSPGSVPIQVLLASLGFSYEHLCRLFKAKFGLSPIRYQNAARLERAKNFLRDPKKTIAEAAYASGFNDPAYFSRLFRERNGMAPSRSRQR
jgi:AraC-like DNA-binding protein